MITPSAVTAAVLSAALIACSAVGCSDKGGGSGEPSRPVPVSDSAAVSPYDWSCLAWDERGRASYVVDGTVRSRTGIDVSEHNGEIDWEAVADDGDAYVYNGTTNDWDLLTDADGTYY